MTTEPITSTIDEHITNLLRNTPAFQRGAVTGRGKLGRKKQKRLHAEALEAFLANEDARAQALETVLQTGVFEAASLAAQRTDDLLRETADLLANRLLELIQVETPRRLALAAAKAACGCIALRFEPVVAKMLIDNLTTNSGVSFRGGFPVVQALIEAAEQDRLPEPMIARLATLYDGRGSTNETVAGSVLEILSALPQPSKTAATVLNSEIAAPRSYAAKGGERMKRNAPYAHALFRSGYITDAAVDALLAYDDWGARMRPDAAAAITSALQRRRFPATSVPRLAAELVLNGPQDRALAIDLLRAGLSREQEPAVASAFAVYVNRLLARIEPRQTLRSGSARPLLEEALAAGPLADVLYYQLAAGVAQFEPDQSPFGGAPLPGQFGTWFLAGIVRAAAVGGWPLPACQHMLATLFVTGDIQKQALAAQAMSKLDWSVPMDDASPLLCVLQAACNAAEIIIASGEREHRDDAFAVVEACGTIGEAQARAIAQQALPARSGSQLEDFHLSEAPGLWRPPSWFVALQHWARRDPGPEYADILQRILEHGRQGRGAAICDLLKTLDRRLGAVSETAEDWRELQTPVLACFEALAEGHGCDAADNAVLDICVRWCADHGSVAAGWAVCALAGLAAVGKFSEKELQVVGELLRWPGRLENWRESVPAAARVLVLGSRNADTSVCAETQIRLNLEEGARPEPFRAMVLTMTAHQVAIPDQVGMGERHEGNGSERDAALALALAIQAGSMDTPTERLQATVGTLPLWRDWDDIYQVIGQVAELAGKRPQGHPIRVFALSTLLRFVLASIARVTHWKPDQDALRKALTAAFGLSDSQATEIVTADRDSRRGALVKHVISPNRTPDLVLALLDIVQLDPDAVDAIMLLGHIPDRRVHDALMDIIMNRAHFGLQPRTDEEKKTYDTSRKAARNATVAAVESLVRIAGTDATFIDTVAAVVLPLTRQAWSQPNEEWAHSSFVPRLLSATAQLAPYRDDAYAILLDVTSIGSLDDAEMAGRLGSSIPGSRIDWAALAARETGQVGRMDTATVAHLLVWMEPQGGRFPFARLDVRDEAWTALRTIVERTGYSVPVKSGANS